MEPSPRITTSPPALRSQDFTFLRTEGLTLIQALAAKSWTDHNLHDPGITLLEAACYALTEAGLRAGMDMRDLLASSGAIRPAELFTATQVLPVAPVTSIDLRKTLIDHPLVSNAWLFPLLPVPRGRWSVLLEFADDALNSNVVRADVSPSGLSGPFLIDLAFPHWDDEDVAPFREDVILQNVTFSGPPGSEWNSIEGSTSFFTRATVTYQPPTGGPQAQELWIVVRIITDLNDPATEAPLVLQEVTSLLSDLGNTGPLKNLNRRVIEAFETMRVIRRFALPYRNLCEDMAEFNAVRIQEVAVSAVLEIGSGVAIEDLLSEIYYRIDQMIAPPIRFRRLDDELQRAISADAVLSGPLVDAGFLADSDLGVQQITHTLYTSDILRLIYQLRREDNSDVQQREDVVGLRIIAVRSLSLSNYIDNRPITTRARDCLQLVKSHRHVPRLSVTKSRIVIYRNGVEVPYEANRVLELFAEKKRADLQTRALQQVDMPPPPGQVFPVREYYPIQNDLPDAYGVGEAGLPEHALPSRRAQARQLKGYLFLFEQMLAGYHAQLAQFNTFFSGDPGVEQTLFQQPLYHLREIESLLKAYDPQSMTWPDFQANETNAYAQVLRQAIETEEQFLDRRNAVLDHLLATLGEDMRDRAALLLRLAAEVPGGESMSLPDLLKAREERKLRALRELIRDKSAYYYDVPALNHDKAQAFGHPLWRRPQLLEIRAGTGGFEWKIADLSGLPLFRQFAPAPSIIEARRTAEQALKLATAANHYTIRVEPTGQRRLEVRNSATANPVAESLAVYLTDPAASAAIAVTAGAALEIWTTHTLSALESRLYHMLGAEVRERHPLLHKVSDFIEIFDNPIPNPNHEKRFRLWELPGFAGAILLESVNNYPGPNDAAATAAALAAAELMIDEGMDAQNYVIQSTGANAFEVILLDPDTNPLARSPAVLGSAEAGRVAADRIRAHLFRLFSMQGCYLIEHHLLFPATNADPALVISEHEDPYSFQITVLFASGYQRDFSIANSTAQPTRPALHRSEEFRKYLEQQVRRFCPAHVLPRVLWIDKAIAGTPVAPDDPSLDALEDAYLAWLRAYLTDEMDEAALGTARNALTIVLNALYEDYYSSEPS
jgi:hypothetical protein